MTRKEALEQESKTDTWSIKDVADTFKKHGLIVVQEPKTGHWIYDRTRDWDGECKYECSECGMGSDVDYAYCMRCGARMIDPQESEDKE